MEEKSLNVFIVDDEMTIVDWMLHNVEWEVYNCRVVGSSTNAVEALSYISENPVDLMLTDISMPEFDGLELIRTVKERFPDMLIIVISAFDKFTYVRDAFQYGIINYCLKPIDENELKKCLETAMQTFQERQMNLYNQDRRIFRDSVFQGLLSGDIGQMKLKEQSTLAGINFEDCDWQVVIADISSYEEEKKISMLKYYRENEHKGYYCFLDTTMNLVFLVYGENVSSESWRVLKFLEKESEMDGIPICIGRPLESWRQIEHSYLVSRDFLEAGFIFGEKILRTANFSYDKYLNVAKNKELQQLVKALKVYDKSGMVTIINNMVDRYETENQRKLELTGLAVFLVKNAVPMLADREVIIGDDYIDRQCTSESMRKWMEHFCSKLVFAREQTENLVHPCVKFALREIHARYSDSTLSLNEIAENRKISSAYLGTLFKEQTGEVFNDYLLRNRLEKVLELLGDSRLNIGTIATATGFTSQSYFNRVFRKKFGMSPAEYRRKMYEEMEFAEGTERLT